MATRFFIQGISCDLGLWIGFCGTCGTLERLSDQRLCIA
jgi:hypothetical protein